MKIKPTPKLWVLLVPRFWPAFAWVLYSCCEAQGAEPSRPPIVEEIRVYGLQEPSDRKKADKPPMLKLREFLDAKGKSRGTTFTESIDSNGTRTVRVTTGIREYWISETRRPDSFSLVNPGNVAVNCWGGGCK